jgi:hypothetical protein
LLGSAIDQQNAEGKQELEHAKALMRETGAVIFKTFVNDPDERDRDTLQISAKAG